MTRVVGMTMAVVLAGVMVTACAPGPEAPSASAASEAALASTPPAVTATSKPPRASAKAGAKGVTQAPVWSNPDFLATEVLGRPTDTSITVNVVPARTVDIAFEYGATSGAYTQRTATQTAVAGAPLETTIDGLQPDSRYYYRMRYGTSVGPEGTFVTQRAPGSTFVFDVQGDSHPERVGKQWDADLYGRALEGVAADRPDFFVMMGDDFSVDTLREVNRSTVEAVYLHQRQWLTRVGAPIFLVNGNHEQAALANLDGTPDNVAVWAQTARNTHFPQPGPDGFYTGDEMAVEHIGLLRDYYAFTWGDALFVVIDPYWHSSEAVDNRFGEDRGGQAGGKGKRDPWSATLGEAQYRWFKETLETSTAAHTFVFAHHVNGTGRGGVEQAGVGEWGDTAGLSANRPGWEMTIHQLMADNGVTIFFQGHDHVFARQELDGVIYQTLPSPADPNETMDQAQAYKVGTVLPGSGRVRVTVAPDTVTVEFVRLVPGQPDEVAFTYTVR